MTDFHKQTGGFVLVRVEKNEATTFVALLNLGELRIIPVQGYVLVVLSNLDPPAASRELDFVAARLPASQ